MKKFIILVSLAICNQLIAATSSVDYLTCAVSSNNLIKNRALEDLNVSSKIQSTFSMVLSEDVDFGSYQTYLHLNLNLNNDELNLDANVEHTKVLKIKKVSPLSFEVVLQSRVVNNPNMNVLVTCEKSSSSYLFVPVSKYDYSAFNINQNVPESMATLHKHANDTRFNAFEKNSFSEFMASKYCITGSVEEAFSDFEKFSSQDLTFWRRKVLQPVSVLFPENLRLEKGSIKWEQPYDSAVCTKSHIEVYDADGYPQEYTICDEYKVTNESPLSLEIKSCK